MSDLLSVELSGRKVVLLHQLLQSLEKMLTVGPNPPQPVDMVNIHLLCANYILRWFHELYT